VQISIDLTRVRLGAQAMRLDRSLGAPGPARISILNGFAWKYEAHEPSSTFSLKWMPAGAAYYEVDGVRHHLTGNNVMLLHPRQAYDMAFTGRNETESFCIFFSDVALKGAQAANEADAEWMSPMPGIRGQSDFASIVFRPPAEVSQSLRWARHHSSKEALSSERLEEELLSLLGALTPISAHHQHLAKRLPAKRSSTRRFLLGRVQRARDIIDDHHGGRPVLEEIAKECGLSKFHLLRLFRAAFGQSPMQYAESCRLRRAVELLSDTSLSISRISEMLAFDTPSAFIKMFRRHTGTTPRGFRRT
jgi:AraC family transcriptional regulator